MLKLIPIKRTTKPNLFIYSWPLDQLLENNKLYRKGEALDAKNRRSFFLGMILNEDLMSGSEKMIPWLILLRDYTSYCGVYEIDDGNLGP